MVLSLGPACCVADCFADTDGDFGVEVLCIGKCCFVGYAVVKTRDVECYCVLGLEKESDFEATRFYENIV